MHALRKYLTGSVHIVVAIVLWKETREQEQFILEGKVNLKGMEWALHILDLLYADQGKLAEAEEMYNRALQGFEEALGPDHTSTLDTVNNLGLLYADQGKLGEAKAMYLRALEGYENALGIEFASSYYRIRFWRILLANLPEIIGKGNVQSSILWIYSRPRTLFEPV